MKKPVTNDIWMVAQTFLTQIGFSTSKELERLDREGTVARRALGSGFDQMHLPDDNYQVDLFDLAWHKAAMPRGMRRIGMPLDTDQKALWAAALLRLIDMLHDVFDQTLNLRGAILEEVLPYDLQCLVNIAACNRAMDAEFALGANFSVVRYVALAVSLRAMTQPNGPTPWPSWKISSMYPVTID